jgi:aarF domain-containing kinase
MPQSQLNKVLKAELGDDWIKRFDYFENMPFAAASIGQVHKGIIGGKEV